MKLEDVIERLTDLAEIRAPASREAIKRRLMTSDIFRPEIDHYIKAGRTDDTLEKMIAGGVWIEMSKPVPPIRSISLKPLVRQDSETDDTEDLPITSKYAAPIEEEDALRWKVELAYLMATTAIGHDVREFRNKYCDGTTIPMMQMDRWMRSRIKEAQESVTGEDTVRLEQSFYYYLFNAIEIDRSSSLAELHRVSTDLTSVIRCDMNAAMTFVLTGWYPQAPRPVVIDHSPLDWETLFLISSTGELPQTVGTQPINISFMNWVGATRVAEAIVAFNSNRGNSRPKEYRRVNLSIFLAVLESHSVGDLKFADPYIANAIDWEAALTYWSVNHAAPLKKELEKKLEQLEAAAKPGEVPKDAAARKRLAREVKQRNSEIKQMRASLKTLTDCRVHRWRFEQAAKEVYEGLMYSRTDKEILSNFDGYDITPKEQWTAFYRDLETDETSVEYLDHFPGEREGDLFKLPKGCYNATWTWQSELMSVLAYASPTLRQRLASDISRKYEEFCGKQATLPEELRVPDDVVEQNVRFSLRNWGIID